MNKNKENDTVFRRWGLIGNNFENQMSISLNSNDEISFVFTPDSNAVSINTNAFRFKNQSINKKGVVPNTKLVYEEDKNIILESPVIGFKNNDSFMTSNAYTQQNPAIFQASKCFAGINQDKENYMLYQNKRSMPLVYDQDK